MNQFAADCSKLNLAEFISKDLFDLDRNGKRQKKGINRKDSNDMSRDVGFLRHVLLPLFVLQRCITLFSAIVAIQLLRALFLVEFRFVPVQ